MAKAAKKGKAGKEKEQGSNSKIVSRNRKARHEYDLIESVEAGIVLTGTEVKSLRNGKANIEEAFASLDDNEVWLHGADIPEYLQANRMNHQPKRPRKLLLHRQQIRHIVEKSSQQGFTLVPLKIYFKNGRAKVEISVARGRKTYDKREALKKKDAQRDIQRALRARD